MPEPIRTFDEQSMRRIARAVKRSETETTPRDFTGGPVQYVSPRGQPINWQCGLNEANQTIPAFSCVGIGQATKGQDGVIRNVLVQPAGSTAVQYGLTGPNDATLPSSSEYTALASYHVEAGLATYDNTGPPNPGESWGPKSGQWTLSKNLPGFIVVRVFDATRNLVFVKPANPAPTMSWLTTSGVFTVTGDGYSMSSPTVYPTLGTGTQSTTPGFVLGVGTTGDTNTVDGVTTLGGAGTLVCVRAGDYRVTLDASSIITGTSGSYLSETYAPPAFLNTVPAATAANPLVPALTAGLAQLSLRQFLAPGRGQLTTIDVNVNANAIQFAMASNDGGGGTINNVAIPISVSSINTFSVGDYLILSGTMNTLGCSVGVSQMNGSYTLTVDQIN